MNDIERRALLGAAGIGAVAAFAKAGPLNPPAGSVAPTGRTLDEIYNKIPAVGGSDGRIAVSAAGTIASPGNYVLVNDIDTPPGGNTFTITANNVTLDLNGFRIGNTLGGYCIVTNGAISNLVIRNGSIVGGIGGIVTDQAGIKGVLLENLRLHGQKSVGISIGGSTSRDCVIRRCEVSECGISSTASDPNWVAIGIVYNGSAARIEDCSVHTLANNGTNPISRGILLNTTNATGNFVSRCHLGNSGGVAGVGILFMGPAYYRDNVVTGYSTAYSGGTNGGNNFG
ncbi:MAG: hypothetical protein QM783_12520 [Phycisphaerales bacterium]